MICFSTPLSIFNLSGKGGLEIDTEGCSIIGVLLECVGLFFFLFQYFLSEEGKSLPQSYYYIFENSFMFPE